MNRLLPPLLRTETSIVRTAHFDQVDRALADTAATHGGVAVFGAHHTGKRVALMSCLADQPVPHVVVPLTPRPSDKDMTRLLYAEVHRNRDIFDLRSMQDELVDTLSGNHCLIVIDNADELTPQAAEQLHWYHARTQQAFSPILLGGPDLGRRASTSARLRGDVLHTIEIKPLPDDQLIPAVREMHQLFAMANHDLLRLIDNQVCHGLLGAWGQFLQHAIVLRNRFLQDRRDEPVLDTDFARLIVAEMPRLPKKGRG